MSLANALSKSLRSMAVPAAAASRILPRTNLTSCSRAWR
uniref:Uncharacterized protein n=1 Tax=Arundo donax TaxID=35708 RepID=A0A0A9AI54_ARUDO